MNPTDEYGLIISERGYDADTCPPENTLFDTRFDTPKADLDAAFKAVGSLNVIFTTTPPVGTTRLFTVTHNLGYKPAHLTYADDARSNPMFSVGGTVVGRYYVSDDFYGLGQILVKANETEFWFEFVRIPDTGGFTLNMVGRTYFFKYFIFVNDTAD